jgi:membrane-associated PAP2 superfamily phosphatase
LVLIAIAGALTGLVFGIFPQLDLRISAQFYDPVQHTWPVDKSALLPSYRNVNALVAVSLAIFATCARAFAALFNRAALLSQRSVLFLLGGLVLGPGLIVNVLLKPLWGRPRPAEVIQFGGVFDFVPWWNPFGQCSGNCSFVSGEVSVAVWLLAWSFVVPIRYRGTVMAATMLNCVVAGTSRIAVGSHFASDVLFAAVLTALALWFTHRVQLPTDKQGRR